MKKIAERIDTLANKSGGGGGWTPLDLSPVFPAAAKIGGWRRR